MIEFDSLPGFLQIAIQLVVLVLSVTGLILCSMLAYFLAQESWRLRRRG